MASTPHVYSHAETATPSFTDSVLSLMRALLAARDPGAAPPSRVPQARTELADGGALDVVHCPHVRVDL